MASQHRRGMALRSRAALETRVYQRKSWIERELAIQARGTSEGLCIFSQADRAPFAFMDSAALRFLSSMVDVEGFSLSGGELHGF